MKKTAVYGGTFNPPHNGHMSVIKAVINSGEVDDIILMPSNQPPHKVLPANAATPRQRLDMVRLAVEGMPHVLVSDLEITAGFSYTLDTVDSLQKSMPETELWLVVGSDMFLTLHQWYRAEELLQKCGIIALSRFQKGTDELLDYEKLLRTKYSAKTKLLHHEPVEISSSRLRELIKNGDGEEYLPENVIKYISEHSLYGAKSENDY